MEFHELTNADLFRPLMIGLWDPFQMAYKWKLLPVILTGMILQVGVLYRFSVSFFALTHHDIQRIHHMYLQIAPKHRGDYKDPHP